MEKILIQILENQKRMSLALRRQIPFGENIDSPALREIEKQCEQAIQKLS
jgi:hypothetical protein